MTTDVAIVTAIVILGMGAAKEAVHAIDRILREEIETSFILIKNHFCRNVFAMI